jgi:hypothetical protein
LLLRVERNQKRLQLDRLTTGLGSREDDRDRLADYRRRADRVRRGLRAARPTRRDVRDGLRDRRPGRRRGRVRMAGCARGELGGGAGHRARVGVPAIQRLGADRPWRVAPQPSLAEPAAADRAAVDDAGRAGYRPAGVPGDGCDKRSPAVDDAVLDRCGPRPEGRGRHSGARPCAPGTGRGERAQRRRGGAVLPRRGGCLDGHTGRRRAFRGDQQHRVPDRLGCGRGGRCWRCRWEHPPGRGRRSPWLLR